MRGSRGKDFRRDQLLARPDAAQGIQPVGQCLSKDDDVGRDSEVLDGPELPGAIKAHLDLVVHHQNVAFIEDFLQAAKILGRWNDIATGALNGLDVKGRELRLSCLGVPEGVIFCFEVLFKLLETIQPAVLSLLVVRTTKTIWKGDKVCPIGEVTVAAAITI